VTVQEVVCKSALVRSGIPAADYALNPYTGCAHGCVYCYASFMARFSPHDRPWGQWVDVKVNIPEMLAKDLGRILRAQAGRSARSQSPLVEAGSGATAPRPFGITISSVTDAYQPLERVYKVTRACLEVLAGASAVPGGTGGGMPAVLVLTKSDLVLRDIDLLQAIPGVDVGMTVTTPDDQVSAIYEPGATRSGRRFAALKKLADAGIATWGFFGPVLPYYSDSPQAVRTMLARFREAGVSRLLVDRFNPYPAAVSRFLKVAPGEASQAFREYRSRPIEYLDRLRDTVTEEAAQLSFSVEVLF